MIYVPESDSAIHMYKSFFGIFSIYIYVVYHRILYVVPVLFNICVHGSCSFASLCDRVDCSPPGCSVQGIFQARIMEQAAISSSKGSSRPRE